MHWYLGALGKYAVFRGRARRREYWMFQLVNVVVFGVLMFVDDALGTEALQLVYLLAVLLPSLAVGVRRLHDTGRSGWWTLIGFVPLVGPIVSLVFTVTEGDRGYNDYGPDPKQAAVAH